MSKKLGELLIEAGVITDDQLREALTSQTNKREKIGRVLVEFGFVTKNQITDAIAKKLQIPLVSCDEYMLPKELKKLIPKETMKKSNIFPIEKEGDKLVLAMADPLDYRTMDNISLRTGLKVSPVISYGHSILKAIEKNFESDEEAPDTPSAEDDTLSAGEMDLLEEKEARDDENMEALLSKGEDPPIIKLVTRVIEDAIQARASDIHIEPREKYTQVRFRIDGELCNASRYEKKIHDSVVSRIKIVSNLDITKRHHPQDGSTHISSGGKEIDLRISTLPTITGEKIVIRLLDRGVGIIPLEELSMSDYIKKSITAILKRPQGMLIVTGPTGSGKTTTLYACLNQIRSESKNIVTIEDPVEYKFEEIAQIQINEAIGRSFASILRSVLRQDPDIIKIGEIRDIDTAEIALRASLTGHLVLTTLHTNSTVSTITRLLDIGIPSYLISSAVTGILAQRLIRTICPHCKIESNVSDSVLDAIRSYALPEITRHYHGRGCKKCLNTGYLGRTAVYEYLPITHAIKRLLTKKDVDEEELQTAAKNDGVISLIEDAWDKVRRGITTVDEVLSKVPIEKGPGVKLF